MNDNTIRRENLIYSATPSLRSDLVTGMGEMTEEDIWEKISDLLEVVKWANNPQMQIWVRDFATDRYTTIEKLLKKKEKRGALRVDHYGKPKVYAKPGKTRGAPRTYRPYLKHEISLTECYIRFQKSKKGTGISSGDFNGFGVIPDFAIEYLTTVLLGEFETKIDTERYKRLEGKVAAYNDHLYEIVEAYKIPVIVTFMLDVDRAEVKRRVEQCKPEDQIYFCDYQTFKSVDRHEVLKTAMWIWKDGKERALTK